MKKTKIVCSIGPASGSVSIMTEMVHNGMNVARINFSHADIEQRKIMVDNIKKVREITGENIAILYDTKGPEFRNGELENGFIELISGSYIKIVKDDIVGNNERFSVNHPSVIDNLNIGNVILLENGLMSIEVIEKTNDYINCKVINGGILGNKKSLSVPDICLNIPFISEADYNDIVYACNHDGDFLALSFVSCSDDILKVRKILNEQNRNDMKIIAKIESQTGIKNIDSILEVSDGIMVARGDLGVEIEMEELPYIQKKLIKKAREHGKICIVATEMLESMKHSSRPTRAEVSDVANAVLDGCDAVMLSGETTVGDNPVETVKYMSSICEKTESHMELSELPTFNRKSDIVDTVSLSAVISADNLDAKVIVVSTMQGYTARKISNIRPNALILAQCISEKVARSLTLCYGVYTKLIPIYDSVDEILEKSITNAQNFINLEKGSVIVITSGSQTLENKGTNLLKIQKI